MHTVLPSCLRRFEYKLQGGRLSEDFDMLSLDPGLRVKEPACGLVPIIFYSEEKSSCKSSHT